MSTSQSKSQSQLPTVQHPVSPAEENPAPSTLPPRNRRWPPNARDLRMYERTVIQEMPQKVVAAEEKLTQGYVSKRVRRVVEWMGRAGNQEYGEMPADEKLRYLQRFAEKKYDHFRQQAEDAWRESRQELVVVKERGTRQASGDNDEQHEGQFVGEVKIERTRRPREGKPQHLREARLALDSLVLLACHCVARKEVQLPPEPDEAAREAQRQDLQQALVDNSILNSKIACQRQEIWILKEQLARLKESAAAPRFDSEAPPGNAIQGAPPLGESGPHSLTAVIPGPPSPSPSQAPPRKLILESHNSACVPLNRLELEALEKDGLAFLAEVGDLIASLEPVNEYDTPFRKKLIELWRNSDRNYRLCGIIPERQKLPRLDWVRKGGAYMFEIPADRSNYARGTG